MATAQAIRTIAQRLWHTKHRQRHQPAAAPARPALNLADALQRECYRRGFVPVVPIEQYRTEGQWITIGGGPAGDARHAGGTPVKVDGSGRITAGPGGLEGRTMGEVDRDKEKPATGERKQAPPEIQAAIDRLQGQAAKSRGESVGPSTMPYNEGFKLWRAMAAAGGTKWQDGKWATMEFASPQGKLWMRQSAGHGIPYPVKFQPGEPGGQSSGTDRTERAGSPDGGKGVQSTPPGKGDRPETGLPSGGRQTEPADPDQAKGTDPAAPGANGRGKQKGLFGDLDPESTKPKKPAPAGDKQKAIGFPEQAAEPAAEPGKPVYGAGLRKLPDGRVVGTATVHRDQLKVDPERFQYKIRVSGPKGVNEDFSEVGQYRPEFGGQLLVWHDPEDGQDYVVNGHHRFDIATRSPYWETEEDSWQGELSARYISAKTPEQARAVGALANIVEGQGKAIDAAKFLRDSGVTPEELKKNGISMKRDMVQNGLALSNASPRLFRRVVDEMVTESRALAICRELGSDPERQDRVLRNVEREEEKGRNVPDSIVARMAQAAAASPKVKSEGGKGGLFGADDDEEDDLMVPRAEVVAAAEREINAEYRAHADVTKRGRGGRYAETGTAVNIDAEKAAAQKADQEKSFFNQQINRKGPLADWAAGIAKELHNARTDTERNAVLARVRQAVRPAVRQIIDGGQAERFCRPQGHFSGRCGGGGHQRRPGRSRVAEHFARAFKMRGWPEPVNYLRELFAMEFARRETFARRKPAANQAAFDWDESKHPRAADGKFGQGGGEAEKTVPGPAAKEPEKQPESMPGQKGLFGEDEHRTAKAAPKANPYVDMFAEVGKARQDTFWAGLGDQAGQGQLFNRDKAGGEKEAEPEKPKPEAKPEPASPESIARADVLIREPQSPEEMTTLFEAVKRHPHYIEAQRRLSEYGPNLTTWSQRQNQDAQGNYTPERTKLHQEIIGRMLNPKAAAPEGTRPKAFFLMGPPAAGKTTAGAPMSKRLGVEFTTINPDDAKAVLPEYQGWNAGALHEESSDITEKQLLPQAIAARHNLQFDLTGKNGEKLAQQAEELANRGYDIHICHVKLPSEKAAYRAWMRFRKGAFATEGEPGRFVDPQYSGVDVDGKPDQTYQRLKNHPAVRSWMQVSTDVPRGQAPQVLDQGGDVDSPKKSDKPIDTESKNARLNSGGDDKSISQTTEEGKVKTKEAEAKPTIRKRLAELTAGAKTLVNLDTFETRGVLRQLASEFPGSVGELMYEWDRRKNEMGKDV